MERRLAAVLAMDVVGYSRQTEIDEEGTLARLKALRSDLLDPKVAEHSGRLVKLMGDGALVEFSSVVSALRCAVDIQRGLAERNLALPESERLELRIGVNLGDIVIEGEDIYGDGVNVAARLEGLAETGGICISGTAYDHVKGKLDVGIESLGERQVKNISTPVRTYKVLLDGAPAALPITSPAKRGKVGLLAAGALAVAAIISAVIWQPWQGNGELELPDEPSIAVLPFDNLNNDETQEYFSDGMTEDLINNLSRYSELFVIARNSSFIYKGQDADVKQIGRELGVAYVVDGSIRRGGDRVRINVQLVDAQSGKELWAEQFDREMTDVFEVQDEITQSIAGQLAPEVIGAEIETARQTPTEDLDSWDLYLRAIAAEAT